MNQLLYEPKQVSKFGRTTILVVEDNPDHLFLIQSALTECMPGVNVTGVSGGRAALASVVTDWEERRALPRLILLDLYLPDRASGLSALEGLKAFFRSEQQPPVPIVMFSHSERADDVKECYQQGANAYMVKSANYEEWFAYFDGLRQYWIETVTLPARSR